MTAAARKAALDRFLPPPGSMPEAERQRRGEAAKRAYFTGLSAKAARNRRKTAEAASETAELLGELAELAADEAL